MPQASATAAPNDRVVLVQRCEDYDPATIQRIVTDGMQRLQVRPAGKVFVKPNVVYAGDPEVFGRHAYTDPQFVGAALRALAAAPDVCRVNLGENSAVGFPTRHCFRNAGYYDELDRVRSAARCPVDIFCMDEDRWDKVPVDGEIHHTLRLSRTMARADTRVYLPKLKCHCVTKMTGAIKLNIGICSDEERAIRHDYRLADKIVDLLAVGWPDLIVMDAIEIGVGNEAFPTPRHLGLILLGTNPLAVDIVGARLLGLSPDEVPYLRRAIERGYGPATLDDVTLEGDLTSPAQLDAQAARVGPHDAAFTAWQDIHAELTRLRSPMRFFWGPHRHSGSSGSPDSTDGADDQRCATGCAMGLKMFLATYERYAGPEAFASAKPVVFVVGRVAEPIDARGHDVFLIGKCARAEVHNARKQSRVERCFTTAKDLTFSLGHRLGMPAPMLDGKMVGGLARDMARSSLQKLWSRRFAQDLGQLVTRRRRD